MKKPHKQTWVKVNAPVDIGISELIEALSLFPKLQTIESCQGNKKRAAWVCFFYGDYTDGHWEELAHFVLGYFGVHLARKIGDLASVEIVVSESGTIRGELSVRPEVINTVTKAVLALARSYATCRKCGYSCDTWRTLQSNCSARKDHLH